MAFIQRHTQRSMFIYYSHSTTCARIVHGDKSAICILTSGSVRYVSIFGRPSSLLVSLHDALPAFGTTLARTFMSCNVYSHLGTGGHIN